MIITRLCYATAVWERSWGGSAALAGPRSVIREVDRPTLEHLLLADYKPQQQLQPFQLSFFDAEFCLGETWPSKRPRLVYFHDNYTAQWNRPTHSMKTRLTQNDYAGLDARLTERIVILCDKSCRCDWPPRLTAFWENTHTHTLNTCPVFFCILYVQ